MDANLIAYLRRNTWSAFYTSLLSQYERDGSLSPRQEECVQRAMDKQKELRDAPRVFTLAVGQAITIRKWIAHRLQNDLGLPYFFRHLEVTAVLNETAKAYHVRVKFISKPVDSCHVCGRDLDDPISIASGIGPICAGKLGIDKLTASDAGTLLAMIEAIVIKVGEIGPIWIPKSQLDTGAQI